jgi:hypothetical protein
MRTNRLLCKPVKCQFEQRSVTYLRTIIGQGQTAINPKKAAAIAEWPTPMSLKEVQSFLGTCNFWQKFIQGFSVITCPLHDLIKKDTPSEWTAEHQQAFYALKYVIAMAPVLKTPCEDLPYLMEMDTSGVALGTVLSQQHDGSWYPVDFHSRSLTPAERNYPTHDTELLAIVNSFKVWCHFLEGMKHDIIVRTDNLALKYFMSSHLLSHQQVGWAQFLSWFCFKIEYAPGKGSHASQTIPGVWKRIRWEFCYHWTDSSMWQCHCPCPSFWSVCGTRIFHASRMGGMHKMGFCMMLKEG